MRHRYRLLAIAVVLATTTAPLKAYLAIGEIQLQAEILAVAQDGSVRPLCAADLRVLNALEVEWELLATTSAVAGAEIREDWQCTEILRQEAPPAVTPQPDCSQTGNTVKLRAYLARGMEDERNLVVQVKTDRSRDCGLESTDEESSQPPPSHYLAEDTQKVIPLKAVNAQGTSPSLLFLRLRSKLIPPDRYPPAAAISITASATGAQVLLDGAEVGRIPESGVLMLSGVRPGLRLITLREAGAADRMMHLEAATGGSYWLSFFADGVNGAGPSGVGLLETDRNEQGYQTYQRVQDDAVMIEVPEGEFVMGNPRTERSPFEHTVYLSTFLIDRTAVTWRQYKEFLSATGAALPPQGPYWGIQDDHPAVYVSWEQARSYCQWAGVRLPTEAEREKAARGTDGRMYPWGEQPPTPELGVFRRTWGNEATDPVGIRPLGASPYGAQDMGGNVWEWCADWYSDEYLENSPYHDPPGPETGDRRVVRGGSWDSRPDVLSASCRNWGYRGYRDGDFGFRCASNAPVSASRKK